MSAATAVRELPRDVFDTIELVALAYGGIGARRWYERDTSDGLVPLCAVGALAFAKDISAISCDVIDETGDAIEEGTSDAAVWAVNERLGRPINARVPFAEWAAELGVTRGDR